MLRTVAEETPTPARLTSSDEGTGSPDAMYSRTSAERIRLARSLSISTQVNRLPDIIQLYNVVRILPRGPAGSRPPGSLEVVPLHGELGGLAGPDLAVFHGDQLGENADRDLLRCDSPDL